MSRTQRLAFSGVMIALACILSMLKVWQMPYGGSITAASMLPIVLVAYRCGTRWGLLTGGVYGLIQLMLGAVTGDLKGLTLGVIIGSVLLDYLVAFAMLGLAGLFSKKIKNTAVAFGLGTFVACLARYLAHIASGFLFFSQYAEWYFSQEGFTFGANILAQYSGNKLYLIYSAVYNGIFMVPETVLTTVLAVVLALILKKYVEPQPLTSK